MLYLIGIGFKPDDITVEGLGIAEGCDEVYLEEYTSIYDKSALGKVVEFKELSREEVEDGRFIHSSKGKNRALLVPGDPLVATTHTSLVTEARKEGIPVKIVHAPSILSAVAETGLQIYKFGKTTTLPMRSEGYEPTSFLDTIRDNLRIKAHTLVLLDPGMELAEGCAMLRELGDIEVVAAHIGSGTEIAFGPLSEVSKLRFKQPCCIVVPSELHFKEEEYLNFYKV
jgi:diphthine synthase